MKEAKEEQAEAAEEHEDAKEDIEEAKEDHKEVKEDKEVETNKFNYHFGTSPSLRNQFK